MPHDKNLIALWLFHAKECRQNAMFVQSSSLNLILHRNDETRSGGKNHNEWKLSSSPSKTIKHFLSPIISRMYIGLPTCTIKSAVYFCFVYFTRGITEKNHLCICNTHERVFAENKPLACSCVMMPRKKKMKTKCLRGKRNKNNNKTHSHCQGRQIAECRPHHHNRIATKKCELWTKRLYVFVHRGDEMCTSDRWKTKNIFFKFQIKKKFIWISTNAKKFLTVNGLGYNSSSDSTIWRSRLKFFHYWKENRRRTFSSV